jgi:hypothetical protein
MICGRASWQRSIGGPVYEIAPLIEVSVFYIYKALARQHLLSSSGSPMQSTLAPAKPRKTAIDNLHRGVRFSGHQR